MPSRVAVLCSLCLASVLHVSTASAQLEPDRLYYGVDRAMPMTANVPAGTEGEVTIELLDPATGAMLGSASAANGRVDLATLFPELWKDAPQIRCAQLLVGDKKVGPSVVLQPMVSPKVAAPARGGAPQFVEMGNTYSGMRTYVDKNVLLKTSEGDILVRLRPDMAPNSVWNFRHLVEGGYYTDIGMHRIIPEFVVQVGDPTATGTGGPGYMIDLEPSTLKHEYGVLSMARSANPDSGGSQFFICLGTIPHLDGSYTSFGEAISGSDVIKKLEATPVDKDGRAVGELPKLISAELVDAAPCGEGPDPVKNPDSQPVER